MTIEQHIAMAKIRESKAEAIKQKMTRAAADEDYTEYKRLLNEYKVEKAMAVKHMILADARKIGVF